jgi:hypothetical protein
MQKSQQNNVFNVSTRYTSKICVIMIFCKEGIIENMHSFDHLKNECNPNHICVSDEHEIKTINLFS